MRRLIRFRTNEIVLFRDEEGVAREAIVRDGGDEIQPSETIALHFEGQDIDIPAERVLHIDPAWAMRVGLFRKTR